MITAESPQHFKAVLPKKVDVVIVGAGIIGISAALHLSAAGKSVLVCEKGRVAGEQSSRNWGWIRQQGRDAAELPIMMESMRIWQRWAEQLGDSLGFERCGVLCLADTDKKAAAHAAWIKLAGEHGLKSTRLSRNQLGTFTNHSSYPWQSGLITTSDARAEPWQAVPTLAHAAKEQGASIIENCAVRDIDYQNGQLKSVHTEMGSVASEQVLICGGAWSSLLLNHLGIGLPQLTVRASVIQTAPCDAGIFCNSSDSEIAYRKRQDGGYSIALTDSLTHLINRDSFVHAPRYVPIVLDHWRHLSIAALSSKNYPGNWIRKDRWSADSQSPFEKNRVLNPKPDKRLLKIIPQRMALRNPIIAKAPILNLWAGMIDTLPDIVPVIDRAPNIDGLWIATGMSGHGFGIGPAVGRILADLIQGKAAGHDLRRFRYARFYDGSPMIQGPMI